MLSKSDHSLAAGLTKARREASHCGKHGTRSSRNTSRKAITAPRYRHSSVPRRAAPSPVLGIPPSRMSGSVVRVMTVVFNGRGSGRFQFGRDKYASHATISLRKDQRRSDQDDGDDGSNCEPISAGWLWYQRRWRKEKWTSLFVAVTRPVQAGAGQAERRPGAAGPDCVPHATAADVGGNASLRDVQVNTMAVRISTTKTVLSCRQHYHRQSCRRP
jgi:hypothetical protein